MCSQGSSPGSILGLRLPSPRVQQLGPYASRHWDAQLVLNGTQGTLSYRQLTAACRQRAHLSALHNTCVAQRPQILSRPYAPFIL